MKKLILACLLLAGVNAGASAQSVEQTKGAFKDKFRQLEEVLPTPNVYRTGSGAPGHAYWQQKADYKINVTLDEDKRTITGSETITYTNNSPDTLKYLWLQLDQNLFRKHSAGNLADTRKLPSSDKMSFAALRYLREVERHDGGHKITAVKDASGRDLAYSVNDTMMRIDLKRPLKPGSSFKFSIDWHYNIVAARIMFARGGYEAWKRHGNDSYFIAQWFPRMVAYTDQQGWSHKQFIGTGEFTLEFGNYDVKITVPEDHIVGSTGELQNPSSVLTSAQRKRLKVARTAKKPVFIVTPDEALENEKSRTTGTKTWHFKAENVRDFAFASSRKFIWDAMGYTYEKSGRTVMAMSLYPEEAMPLWDKYSTHAVHHTLKTYTDLSFEYPYPVSWSVKGPIGGGMEYPMITSNGPMPVIHDDGTRTYSRRAKYGLISVIIHEIGHNYYPMIVNSDERNWAWMDEGLNSFVQSVSERAWEENYPSRYGRPQNAIPYMLNPNQTPIMTQSESIIGYFPNAYTKPAVALNILRETVMGRELFDFAFREYSQRWMFKRPYPADFFRSLEDASGTDLDWFWRGWFYTTDHVDIAITGVSHAVLHNGEPDATNADKRARDAKKNSYVADGKNTEKGMVRRVETYPDLKDFYNENDPYVTLQGDRDKHAKAMEGLSDWQKELAKEGRNFYYVDFENIGGLVMPIILDVAYDDGSLEQMRFPAEIWRKNAKKVTRLIISEKEITSITLDPNGETADADLANNDWPAKPHKTRLELFKAARKPDQMRRHHLDSEARKNEDEKAESKE